MAGLGRFVVAAMLAPVDRLSDDDAGGEDPTPMKKPAARETKKVETPKGKPPPEPVPKRKGVLRKANKTGSSPDPKPTPKKKPASVKCEMKLSKYLYKKDGVWGFKINQKQVMLAPRLQTVCLQFKFQQQYFFQTRCCFQTKLIFR